MRRRLYFVLPNVESAKRTADGLLLARVEDRHMRFLARLGAWMASMAGAAVPNSRLKQFHADIEAGRVLMMVDVPFRRVAEITELVVSRHPEAVPRGEAIRYVFP